MNSVTSCNCHSTRLLFLAAAWLFGFSSNGLADYLACHHSIFPTLKEISSQRAELFRQIPKVGTGIQIPIGSCASRIGKLQGGEKSTFANMAKTMEQIACLDLKKYYLEKTCECSNKGSSFTKDEVLQDQTFEMYAAAMKLRNNAVKKGIKTPLIQAHVRSLNEAIDCINVGSIAIIKQSMDDLEKAIAVRE